MILTESGIKPDPKKVEAIHNWPTPKNITELLSFLGSVNYLSQFIPELSHLRKPLQTFVKKDSELSGLLNMIEPCLIQFYDQWKPL